MEVSNNEPIRFSLSYFIVIVIISHLLHGNFYYIFQVLKFHEIRGMVLFAKTAKVTNVFEIFSEGKNVN